MDFKISFDPTIEGDTVNIIFPNGKTITCVNEEVRKHLTRAIAKACGNNGMKRKASLLRSFMKADKSVKSCGKKWNEFESHFLDISSPLAKRTKGKTFENDSSTTDVQGTTTTVTGADVNKKTDFVKKRGSWSVEEDQKIFDHVERAQEISEDVDWFMLASSLQGRNDNQCERRFKKLTVKNKKKEMKRGGWTTEEDSKIIEHVNEVGDCKWSIVASLLPGRFAKQCSNRYKKLQLKEGMFKDENTVKSNREGMKKGGWTAEEDCKILEHVNMFGDCKWHALTSRLPERVAKQCRRRYKKLQNKEEDTKREALADQNQKTIAEIDAIPAVIAQANIGTNDFETNDTATAKKKGNWSVEEDQKILNHVKEAQESGTDVDWLLLASTVPGRNEKQCERRYNNLTSKNKKKGMKKGGWTAEEDCKIIEYVKTFGDCKWSALASRLPERIAKQCEKRYKKLQKKEEDSKREAPAELTEKTIAEIDVIPAVIAQANIATNDFETNDTATAKKKGNWSVEEDQKILNHVKEKQEIGNDVDWLLLASTVPGRNEKQCERRYNNLTSKNKNRSMKKGGWTAEEDCKIMEHVNTFGDCKWSVLASQLSERVGKQCKRRYKKLQMNTEDSIREASAKQTEETVCDTESVTSGIVKMTKTDTKASNTSHCRERSNFCFVENQKIMNCVKDTEEINEDVDWLLVKADAEASNTSRCMKKGNWSLEEDQKILNYVKDTEETCDDVDWCLLASSLLGRNEDQCERRYSKLMFKNKEKEMKKGNWTVEEDHEIIGHVKEFGDNKWHIVASRLSGRYPKQCMNRYKRLQQMKRKEKCGDAKVDIKA